MPVSQKEDIYASLLTGNSYFEHVSMNFGTNIAST
jgi:hypothetical protein